MPILIKLLGVKPHAHAEEERDLRLLMATNVISFIDHELSLTIDDQIRSQVKRPYTEMTRKLSRELKKENGNTRVVYPEGDRPSLVDAKREIHQFQRQLLINFHQSGTFDHATLRRLEQELDYEEAQLHRMDKKSRT